MLLTALQHVHIDGHAPALTAYTHSHSLCLCPSHHLLGKVNVNVDEV